MSNMTAREEYKKNYRQQRLAATDGFGERLGQLATGQVASKYDNSHLWAIQQQVAKEVAPQIKRNQIAWANLAQI